jgi:phage-related protein
MGVSIMETRAYINCYTKDIEDLPFIVAQINQGLQSAFKKDLILNEIDEGFYLVDLAKTDRLETFDKETAEEIKCFLLVNYDQYFREVKIENHRRRHWAIIYEKYQTIKSGRNKGKMEKIQKHETFYGTWNELEEYLDLDVHGILKGYDYIDDDEEEITNVK